MSQTIEFSDQVLYDLDDIVRKRYHRNEPPYHELVVGPWTAREINSLLAYESDLTPVSAIGLKFRWGTLKVVIDVYRPEKTLLLR